MPVVLVLFTPSVLPSFHTPLWYHSRARTKPLQRLGHQEPLHLQPQIQHSLRILHNLIPTQFTLPIQPIHKRNRHLRDRKPHRLRPHHHLHLKRIPLTLRTPNHLLQHLSLIQPKTARQITHARPKQRIRKQIRPPANQFAFQIPAIHAAVAGIPRAGDDVIVALLLHADHLGDEFGVVRKVGVHDDDEVAGHELEAVDVGGAETEFAGSGFEDDVRGVDFFELSGYVLSSVGGGIVDDYDFPVEFTKAMVNGLLVRWEGGENSGVLLFCKGLVQ